MAEIKYREEDYYILLNRVRLGYPSLFKAKVIKGETDMSKARFSCVPILDKKLHAKEIAIIQRYHDKLEKSLKLGVSKKSGQPIELAGDKTCWHDGSDKEADGFGEDVMYLKVSSQKRPGIVDVDLTPLVEEDRRPYAGCYVNIGINLKAWDNEFGKRISGYFNNVQFCEHGDAFGGSGMTAEDEFGDTTTQAPASGKSKTKPVADEEDDW